MIEGHQEGPFTVSQLPEAGITPDTYVWCKGMPDWEQASKVADICRFYRLRLSGVAQEPSTPEDQAPEPPFPEEAAGSFGEIMRQVNRMYAEQMQERQNPTEPPRVSLALAIATSLICFPPTGFVAIYQCAKASRLWQTAPEGEQGRNQRVAAHDAARSARMWTGITLCLGLIAWAAVTRFAY